MLRQVSTSGTGISYDTSRDARLLYATRDDSVKIRASKTFVQSLAGRPFEVPYVRYGIYQRKDNLASGLTGIKLYQFRYYDTIINAASAQHVDQSPRLRTGLTPFDPDRPTNPLEYQKMRLCDPASSGIERRGSSNSSKLTVARKDK